MKKLRLDDLAVESFATGRGGTVYSGTVRGQQATHPSNDPTFCYNANTCLYSCIWPGCYTQAPNETCENTQNQHVFTCGREGCGGGGTGFGETCYITCAKEPVEQ